MWFKVIIRLTSAKLEVEVEAELGNKAMSSSNLKLKISLAINSLIMGAIGAEATFIGAAATYICRFPTPLMIRLSQPSLDWLTGLG